MMKKKLVILLVSFLFMGLGLSNLNAQVTIGSANSPEKGALLDLKEKNAASPNAVDVSTLENSEKGLLHPKVSLKAWNQLTPLYGGTDQGNDTWSDESTANEKLLATGMIVYNVNEKALDLTEGLFMWRIDEWIKISGGLGTAQFDPVDCSKIFPNGAYVEGIVVDANNYLKVQLNVKKPGTYSISVTSGNGYSFFMSGVALDLGELTLNIPAQGTPLNVQTDKLTVTGFDLVAGCEPEIVVVTAVAEYSLNCASMQVNGMYFKGRALTATNTITMNVNVALAGSYYVATSVTNGIQFTATGSFASAGTHAITLLGTGSPTVNVDFPVELIANTTSGNDICSIVIPITLPAMTYAVIGSNDHYTWMSSYRKEAIADPNGVSFGLNGLVRIESFTMLWNTTSVAQAGTWLTTGNGGNFPDVVLYYCYGAIPNAALSTALINYINKGGCLIFGSADSQAAGVNLLMNGIFGMSTAASTNGGVTGEDNVYQINNLPSDPIINGPFGNLASRHWGEDNATAGSIVLTQLPPNSVQICAAVPSNQPAANPNVSIVWYNNTKNFVYIGDSVAAASSSTTTTSGWPAIYDKGAPVSKLYGPGAANNRYVYNSALELNSVAWCIRKAAVSGINPH